LRDNVKQEVELSIQKCVYLLVIKKSIKGTERFKKRRLNMYSKDPKKEGHNSKEFKLSFESDGIMGEEEKGSKKLLESLEKGIVLKIFLTRHNPVSKGSVYASRNAC
jgi:hypothetical protein